MLPIIALPLLLATAQPADVRIEAPRDQHEVVVADHADRAPPPRFETVDWRARPSREHSWEGGRWVRDRHGWGWAPGHWVRR